MYQVRLSDFEGPLDLLLFFIQRDELDVYDIPIASIADEYLDYVRLMDVIDLDSAGEFIYMSALLISIKARMLLPRSDPDGDEEIIDPRKELVERLVEYVKFRDAAEQLGTAWDTRSAQFSRDEPDPSQERATKPEDVEYDVSVFQLIAALKRVLDGAAEETAHLVRATDYSVEEQRDWLKTTISGDDSVSFASLVKGRPKLFIITTFLAILEVVRDGDFRILLGPSSQDFYLARKDVQPMEQEQTTES